MAIYNVYNQKSLSTNLNIVNRRIKSCVSGWDCFIKKFRKKQTKKLLNPNLE